MAPRPAGVLVAMVLSLGMLTIDVTAVRVALPVIQRELGGSDAAQAWIVNGYLLSLGVLVVAGGRAGDLLGRRRVFLAGLAVFTLCSVLCALAPTPGALVAARIAQGAGAAVMTPGVYSIVADSVPASRLSRSMGVLTGTAAVGLSVGPLLGGLLVDLVDWRAIFLINVPLGLLAGVLVHRTVPEVRSPGSPKIDLPGVVVLAVALTAVNVALLQGGQDGWTDPLVLGLVGLAVVAAVGFWAVESRAAAPLVPPSVLRDPTTAAANAVGFCAQFVSTAVTVLVALHLQDDLGRSALATGLLLLPMTVPLVLASPLSGALVPRFGTRAVVVTGMSVTALGVAGVAVGALHGGYLALVPGLVAFGFGFAAVLTALTTALLAGAAQLDRGMVSGVYNTARNVGASVGLATTSGLLITLDRAHSASSAFAAVMALTAAVAAIGALAALRTARAGRVSAGAGHPPG